MSFKVTDFGTSQQPISDDFQRVNNINLRHISHRFRNISDYWLNLYVESGVPPRNVLAPGEPPSSVMRNLTSKTRDISLLYSVKCISISLTV